MKIIDTASAPKAIGPYAQAVLIDGWLFSPPDSLTAELPAGRPRDIEAQTEQVSTTSRRCWRGRRVLAQVVKSTVFVKDLEDFARPQQRVHARRFGAHTPAWSTVEVARLPRDEGGNRSGA